MTVQPPAMEVVTTIVQAIRAVVVAQAVRAAVRVIATAVVREAVLVAVMDVHIRAAEHVTEAVAVPVMAAVEVRATVAVLDAVAVAPTDARIPVQASVPHHVMINAYRDAAGLVLVHAVTAHQHVHRSVIRIVRYHVVVTAD